jgi:hypothetical protein
VVLVRNSIKASIEVKRHHMWEALSLCAPAVQRGEHARCGPLAVGSQSLLPASAGTGRPGAHEEALAWLLLSRRPRTSLRAEAGRGEGPLAC